MSDVRETLVARLAEHMYDRGGYVPDWPEDERILHRDGNQWNSFTERAEKVQRLRFEKAVDALLAEFLVVPRSKIVTEYGVRPDPMTFRYLYGDRVGAMEAVSQPGARVFERPVLPWSPIPLPEDGDSQ